jgi:hypothetical protein
VESGTNFGTKFLARISRRISHCRFHTKARPTDLSATILEGEALSRSPKIALSTDLGPEASALSFPGGDEFVPKEGEQ